MIRGIVEGFYGDPWTKDERQQMMQILGGYGATHYLFGPKDEPGFRADWRTPFSREQLARFQEMLEAAEKAGLVLGFALSPGLDIDFGSGADLEALIAKFQQLARAGIPWLGLFWDDIDPDHSHRDLERFPDPGHAQAWVTNQCREALATHALAEPWVFCPTEYWGRQDSPYRRALRDALHPSVHVIWTGPGICSEAITGADAAQVSAQFGHPLVIWDNYPVNDADMVHELHLGPLEGRDTDVLAQVAGYLANPMDRPWASVIPLLTILRYLQDPTRYDPWKAWEEALRWWGERFVEPLRQLGWATRYSCCGRGSAVEQAFTEAVAAGRSPDASAVDAVLAWRQRSLDDFPEPLRDEIRPWVEKLNAVSGWLAAFLARDAVSVSTFRAQTENNGALVFGGQVERWLRTQEEGQ
ncbi:MAG: beta-N-acetylglucosaminidase domain-containing protein [Firmicutes bacterium]|nr:beta-N-acetylglucosaminidase domain-containing protein [Bacillota bacterium]